ncbi:hypothetical protein [Paludisphaera rhizosphaerae]|uniref:hypothetical protein n=1 Tax=Paludisphaera rhizosphaerae TaxID=2711216 RepID=UPI0013EC0CB0|nr:hypothetical protein [Paludisphaera rhizosphaerae]
MSHHHHDEPEPEELDELEVSLEVERLAIVEAIEARNRLWLRAILPLLQQPPIEPDPNPRVQFAFDRMRIAACERAARILASDVETPA